MIRDARQFRYGFEPTRTSYPMLLESLGAILKRATSGITRSPKGKGVLEIEGKFNMRTRGRYLALIRKECPDCVISIKRESHGTETFQIEFPDRYYIRSSLDAGALEWQTEPEIIPDLKRHIPLLQHSVFDLAATAGARLKRNLLGGHSTFSGFGNDTFWYGNYLKFRAKNYDLDWGFFGKDDYNARPVALWASDQQKKYAAVHAEHDARWAEFLKDLETKIQNHASDEALMKLYQDRKVMSVNEYSDQLMSIYSNPKKESKYWGTRDKPKYVANKPGYGLIENRAIDAQAKAEDLLKMAEFMDAEAWYVKEKLNQNLEMNFIPGAYVKNSRRTVAENARKITEELGLDWQDYSHFTKRKYVNANSKYPSLADGFTESLYGAAKRDQLFLNLRDHFLAKPSLSPGEQVFLSDLLNEMSYTVTQSIENAKLLSTRLTPAAFKELSREDTLKVTKNLVEFSKKFPAASEEILRPLQTQLREFIRSSLASGKANEARFTVQALSPASQTSVLKEVAKEAGTHSAADVYDLYGDLLKAVPIKESSPLLNDYYQNIVARAEKGEAFLPAHFENFLDQSARIRDTSLADQAIQALVKVNLESKTGIRITNEGATVLEALAHRNPAEAAKLLIPYRQHYAKLLSETEFGLNDHYKAIEYFDRLNRVTPDEEKGTFLRSTLAEVKKMHTLKNDPDSENFLETVELKLKDYEKNLKSGSSAFAISPSCITGFKRAMIVIFGK
jgi:hypothetical protein